MIKDKLPYCGELVRNYDNDRFLVSLLMPPEHREALWALFAFNYEIAKTRELVTETTIGLIRLQWWRDALAKIYDGGGADLQNEILSDLRKVIQTYDLPQDLFEKLIYAREFDLENVPPASLQGLENYADFTNVPLLKLALKILGQDEDEEVIRGVAVAYGLAGLLRAVPFHAAQSRSYMPADLMTEHNDDISKVGKLVTVQAFDCLDGVKPRSKFLKMTNILVLLYLKQIKALEYDIFSPKLAETPAFFHLRFFVKGLF